MNNIFKKSDKARMSTNAKFKSVLKNALHFESKVLIWVSLGVYFILIYIYCGVKTNFPVFLGDYESCLNSTIQYYALCLSFISLKWIYDTKEAIQNYGQKNKILGIINRLNRLLSRSGDIPKDEFIELIAEIQSVKPSKILQVSNVGSGDDKLDLDDLENGISGYVMSMCKTEDETYNLAKDFNFKLRLYMLKTRLENTLMEFKNNDTK